MKRIAIAASLLLAAAAIAGSPGRRAPTPSTGTAATRTTRSRSRATARSSPVPTSASFSFGVDVRAATAKAALAANAREMRQVIAAVKAAGGRDVGTQSVSLSQVLSEQRRADGLRRLERRLGDDRRRPGRSPDRRGRRGGRNQVNGPRCRSPTRERSTARRSKAAMADARLSAETLAAAAGRSLGKVTSVVESGGATPSRWSRRPPPSTAATPIEAGTQEMTASVSVTFALG